MENYKAQSPLLKVVHKTSEVLLDNPYMYNYVRFFLAGKQTRMKNFVYKHLSRYNCKTVADFCCGTGDFAQILPSHTKYLGLDLNPAFINYARQRFSSDKKKRFMIADVVKFASMTKKTFDSVLLISAIHHLSDEELELLLPKVKRIATKVIIIADIIPNPPNPIQKFFASIDRGHYVRTKQQKISILKKHFKVVSTEYIPTVSAVQLGIVCEVK